MDNGKVCCALTAAGAKITLLLWLCGWGVLALLSKLATHIPTTLRVFVANKLLLCALWWVGIDKPVVNAFCPPLWIADSGHGGHFLSHPFFEILKRYRLLSWLCQLVLRHVLFALIACHHFPHAQKISPAMATTVSQAPNALTLPTVSA